LLFGLCLVSACPRSAVWLPSDGTPSSSRVKLMGFMTGLCLPQICIRGCKPEKDLSRFMLLQFRTALSSERGSGLDCRKEGVGAK